MRAMYCKKCCKVGIPVKKHKPVTIFFLLVPFILPILIYPLVYSNQRPMCCHCGSRALRFVSQIRNEIYNKVDVLVTFGISNKEKLEFRRNHKKQCLKYIEENIYGLNGRYVNPQEIANEIATKIEQEIELTTYLD